MGKFNKTSHSFSIHSFIDQRLHLSEKRQIILLLVKAPLVSTTSPFMMSCTSLTQPVVTYNQREKIEPHREIRLKNGLPKQFAEKYKAFQLSGVICLILSSRFLLRSRQTLKKVINHRRGRRLCNEIDLRIKSDEENLFWENSGDVLIITDILLSLIPSPSIRNKNLPVLDIHQL